MNFNLTPPTSPKHLRVSSNLTKGTISGHFRQKTDDDNFDEYSYNLSQLEKRTN